MWSIIHLHSHLYTFSHTHTHIHTISILYLHMISHSLIGFRNIVNTRSPHAADWRECRRCYTDIKVTATETWASASTLRCCRKTAGERGDWSWESEEVCIRDIWSVKYCYITVLRQMVWLNGIFESFIRFIGAKKNTRAGTSKD